MSASNQSQRRDSRGAPIEFRGGQETSLLVFFRNAPQLAKPLQSSSATRDAQEPDRSDGSDFTIFTQAATQLYPSRSMALRSGSPPRRMAAPCSTPRSIRRRA